MNTPCCMHTIKDDLAKTKMISEKRIMESKVDQMMKDTTLWNIDK